MRSTCFWVRGSAIGLLALVTLGCFRGGTGGDEDDQPKTTAATASGDGSIHLSAEQISLAGLQIVTANQQMVEVTITAPAEVKPRAAGESPVYSPFSGRLIADPATLPRVGTTVKRGEVLAEVEQILDASQSVQINVNAIQMQSSMDQAEKDVELARQEDDRARGLYRVGATSLKQRQIADTALEQAQIKLQAARQAKEQYELAKSSQVSGPRRIQLRSPIDGVVVTAAVTPGQQVDPTLALFTVADLRRVWVEAEIFESDLEHVNRASRAAIITRAYPGVIFTGRLVTVGNVVDPANRTVQVIYEVQNPTAKLKLGMYAEVEIPTGARTLELVVPAQALVEDSASHAVFVQVRPGVFVQREVTIGARTSHGVVLKSGLKPGEQVVTSGVEVLRSQALRGLIPSAD